MNALKHPFLRAFDHLSGRCHAILRACAGSRAAADAARYFRAALGRQRQMVDQEGDYLALELDLLKHC